MTSLIANNEHPSGGSGGMTQNDLMPKPRLAMQIGITGHRLNKLETDHTVTVERALRTLYTLIETSVAGIAAQTRDRIYSATSPLIRIVGALAEGADRLAVTASPADWQLEAVLPMPRADYAHDFRQPDAASPTASLTEFERLLAKAASVTELPWLAAADKTDDAARAQQYQALGLFLIRQIDVLIAVWDGRQAEGPGGTATVVAAALDEGRPVLWIDPNDATGARLLLALDTGAGTNHRAEAFDAAASDKLLGDILLPPAPPAAQELHEAHRDDRHGAHEPAPDAALTELPSYFRLSWPKPMRWPFAYTLLRRAAGPGRWSWPIAYPSFNDLAKSWDGFFAGVAGGSSGDAAAFNGRLRAVLLPRSIWADALAWYYGQLYRSAYVSIFILAGLSVPIGLCYLVFLESPAILDIKAGFVVVELLIISTVVIVVRRGVRHQWHAVWLETRELSELLRLGRSLAYVGALRDFVTAPHPGTRETLPSWYVRATFREIGLPTAVLDADYLRDILKASLATEIEDQRAYHAANAKNLGKIHHMLHHKGDACFVATIAILLVYLVAWAFDHFALAAHAQEHAHAEAHPHGLFHEFLEYVLKPIVSIAAAGLPAFGAALSGIRAQGDFEGFAQRSATTQRELADVERQISALLAASAAVDLKTTTDILLAATRVMARDVSAWQQLYVSKRLTLPA
jgi:hypothetical protein